MADGKFITLDNGRKKLQSAIDVSTGTADACKILKTDATGRIDPTFLPVGIGDDSKMIEASEALDAGDFVNIFDDAGTTKVRKADASNDRPAHGFVNTAAAAASQANVFFEGENNALSGLTGGSRYYLDTAGNITTTPKTTAGELHQFVGVACTATELNAEISESVQIC